MALGRTIWPTNGFPLTSYGCFFALRFTQRSACCLPKAEELSPPATVSGAYQIEAPTLNVRVLCAKSQIWTLAAPAPVEVAVDESNVGHVTLAGLEAAFRAALSQPDRRGSVKLDGMAVHISWRHFFSTLSFEGVNPDPADQLGAFLRTVIQTAFDAIKLSACRDGLARAAGNVGMRLPLSNS
jgi:hypothetical protein